MRETDLLQLADEMVGEVVFCLSLSDTCVKRSLHYRFIAKRALSARPAMLAAYM